MRTLYSFLFSIFSIFYFPFFWLKGKGKGGVGSRFGRVPEAAVQKLENRKVIWIHAVSVGEVALALRLANHWRALIGGGCFVLTATTVAGYEVASKSKHPEDVVLHFPVDFGFSVRRFISGVNPRAVVMLETEIWPRLVWELSARGIPVFILNGRLSDKAIGKYRLVKFFIGPLLNRFTGIGAQDETMRGRFLELGAAPEKVQVAGNLKFDWEPSGQAGPEIEAVRRTLSSGASFLCLAASTHEGEEAILLDAFLALRRAFPGFGLILAPRHLDRLSSLESLAAKKGIRLKRVFTEADNGYDDRAPAVWLLDRMGALQHLYSAAEVVFVGGSLVAAGGHNPAEAAYHSKPVMFGPFMNNFLEMSRLFLEAGAAVRVGGARDLEDKIFFLINDQEARRRMGVRAKNILRDHRGALEKNTEIFFQSTGDLWK